MTDLRKASLHITGIVQGVGFRPFVYGLAARFALQGWVRNTSAGVDIEVDGTRETLEAFILALKSELPPLARIDTFSVSFELPGRFTTFEIIPSAAVEGAFQPISPDVCICPDCLRELFDPSDRRYRYPFINCTNCGPRFTIITDIPYDRPNTTMANTRTHSTGAFTPSPLPARFAGRMSGWRPVTRLPPATMPSLRPSASFPRAGSLPSRAWADSTCPVTPPMPNPCPNCAAANCAWTSPLP
jgi:acylphosphatase